MFRKMLYNQKNAKLITYFKDFQNWQYLVLAEAVSYTWVHKLVHNLTKIQFGSFHQIFKCGYFDLTAIL